MIVCGQGKSISYRIQLRGGPPARAPLVGVFAGTEPLTGLIWPAGATPASRLATVPVPTWLDGPNGLVAYQLTTAASATIPPGTYRTNVVVTVGTEAIDAVETDLVIYATGLTATAAGVSPILGPDATALGLVSTLYATDEQIALKCGPDFTALWPSSQLLAWGTDGVFSPSDPWTLTSGSNQFASQGVAVGGVVWLRKPASAFPAGGMLMAVAAVSASGLTLRRLGMPSSFGMSPAPAAGLAGVEFMVCTFNPQTENATYELNQRYSIDAAVAGRSPSDVNDLRVLRAACITMVLIDRYSDESRTQQGDYAPKLAMLEGRLGELLASLQLRWGPTTSGEARVSNFFSTRIVR